MISNAAKQQLATLLLANHLWVRVDSFGGRDFSGAAEQIAREVEFTPRSLQTMDDRVKKVFGIKVRFDDTTSLRAGMAADVFFPDAGK